MIAVVVDVARVNVLISYTVVVTSRRTVAVVPGAITVFSTIAPGTVAGETVIGTYTVPVMMLRWAIGDAVTVTVVALAPVAKTMLALLSGERLRMLGLAAGAQTSMRRWRGIASSVGAGRLHTRSATRQVGVTVVVEVKSIVVERSTSLVMVSLWVTVWAQGVLVVTRVTGGAVRVLQLEIVVVCWM